MFTFRVRPLVLELFQALDLRAGSHDTLNGETVDFVMSIASFFPNRWKWGRPNNIHHCASFAKHMYIVSEARTPTKMPNPSVCLPLVAVKCGAMAKLRNEIARKCVARQQEQMKQNTRVLANTSCQNMCGLWGDTCHLRPNSKN